MSKQKSIAWRIANCLMWRMIAFLSVGIAVICALIDWHPHE